jgi:hypothetical protein
MKETKEEDKPITQIAELDILQFKQVGYWELKNEKINYVSSDLNNFKIKNVAYAFIENPAGLIKYIGKTTMSLEKRFSGYIKGYGKSTNHKNHNKILNCLKENKKIDIYALLDVYPINWGKFNINLAAGLEDALIAEFQPEWNGGKTESQLLEIQTLENNDNIKEKKSIEEDANIFTVKLGETYFNSGFINPGVKYSYLLGLHEEDVDMVYKNEKILTSKISRTANGSEKLVRLYGGKQLVEFYKKYHYKIGDTIEMKILNKNKIEIL